MSIVVLSQFILNRFKCDYVTIDNSIFRLHYRTTFAILTSCSLIFYWNWGVGDIIDCIGGTQSISSDDLDEYCKIQGSYTTFPRCGKQQVGVHTLGPYVTGAEDGDPVIGHRTYQWFGMIFFIQALFFYVPHYLWKIMEDGHVKQLVDQLTGPVLVKETISSQTRQLVDYLAGNMGNYDFYFGRYVFCELLNLINIGTQILILEKHFDFLSIGPSIITFLSRASHDGYKPQSRVPAEVVEGLSFKLSISDAVKGRRGGIEYYCYENVSPMELHFATLTKCKFETYGPSGNVQPNDAVCVLWLNALTQRIFIFLWFWLVLVFSLTALAICYRVLILLSFKVRMLLLKSKYPMCEENGIAVLSRLQRVGDWFILYQISKNLDHEVAHDVIQDLLKRLGVNERCDSQNSASVSSNCEQSVK